MFCSQCGKKLRDGARFCAGCGVAISAGAPAGPTAEQQSEHAPEQLSESPPQPQQQAAPQQYQQQPQQQAPPQQQQYQPQPGQQYQPPQQQYQPQPPKPKKSKKPLFGIAGAAAAVLVFFLVIFPMIGGDVEDEPVSGGLNITIGAETSGGRDAGFNIGEAHFTTNDPVIKMIEVNQGLSYGFDSETGEFYLVDNFVAGKETAIFVALDEPLDPKADIRLTIEKDDEIVATLSSVELFDDRTLLFQPKDIKDVGFWEQGYYTFTFEMEDSVAVRKTNFFKAMPMKILAVPIATNYSGDVKKCEDDWKLGSTMITATYPLARDDVEYILGPEQDLSDPMYDVNTKEGRKRIWQHLMDLQTPNNEYTMIVGFIKDPTKQGYLGFTYGEYATIVCESEPDLLATVVHEIAHCYIIGDEYPGGHLNDILNPPPYGMEGKDMLTRGESVGTKEHVKGGSTVGLKGTGSVIYPEQRAYWPEGRQALGTVTSYMGGGTGEDSLMFWTSSDIWNHLFKAFTGQLTGDEAGYGAPGDGGDSDSGEGDGSEKESELFGQCYHCFGNVYEEDGFVACRVCGEMTLISGDDFKCEECGTAYEFGAFDMEDVWIYHSACGNLLFFPAFYNFNSIVGTTKTTGHETMVLEIVGDMDPGGAFYPEPWFSYEATPVAFTANRKGEYSAALYDAGGKRLSLAHFDAIDTSQITSREGVEDAIDTGIPIRVTLRYPDDAASISIKQGSKEIYKKELSQSAPKVAFTGLTEGQKLSNDTTLTWEVTGADADNLTFQIWYCRSNEKEFLEETEEYLVAGRLKGTSYAADLSSYPGSAQGWFRILASDGTKTGMAESPKVSLPYRAPDILNNIPEGKQFKVTDEIEIHGKVFDAQDGWLWNKGYEWHVDGKEWNNYGNFYFYHTPYMLKPGEHTITMTVTNSGGVSSTKDFLIEVVDDESDLPDDWPRNDITLALRMGFYQPLDRLDAPITRLEYAKMMFSSYTLSLPEELPADWERSFPDDILIQFTDMSGEGNDMDYMYALSAVAMGIMELKNAEYEYIEELGFTYAVGEFDPHGLVTEREAMQIMCMNIELAKANSYTTYEVLDESEFVPQLTELGLLDEPGSFNSYKADERMSRGMTMVRIARYIKLVYELDDKDYGSESGFFDNFYKD